MCGLADCKLRNYNWGTYNAVYTAWKVLADQGWRLSVICDLSVQDSVRLWCSQPAERYVDEEEEGREGVSDGVERCRLTWGGWRWHAGAAESMVDGGVVFAAIEIRVHGGEKG